MGKSIELTAADGARIGAYRADPPGTPRGGIVIAQEIFGVNAHIRSVADRFAEQGYVAIAPALFDRLEKGVELGYTADDMGPARALMQKASIDNALKDVAAAVAVAATAGKVAVVGYCWGGTVAWAAAGLPGIVAAVAYYGGGIAARAADTPKVPVLAHFGETDQSIPLSDVDKIRAAQPGVEVHVYPGAGHGFNCDMRGSYNEGAARVAQERTIGFLRKHVG